MEFKRLNQRSLRKTKDSIEILARNRADSLRQHREKAMANMRAGK